MLRQSTKLINVPIFLPEHKLEFSQGDFYGIPEHLIKGECMHSQGSQSCQIGFSFLLEVGLNSFGIKFFPSRVVPFSEGVGVPEGIQDVTKVDSLVKSGQKITMCIMSPMVIF